MLLLGIDLGSSSVKVSILDGESGQCVSSAFMPRTEMDIMAVKPGWAEQEPSLWWDNLKVAVRSCTLELGKRAAAIGAIGISYQMHGLVMVGKDLKPLRPSIIWCDSRAVEYGNRAFNALGKGFCLSRLLNSPSNFTASKLAWVKENEPGLFRSIYKIMLPGDYIAMRMTGELKTSFSGLSEGIFWDYSKDAVSDELMNYFGFSRDILPDAVSSFEIQGVISGKVAGELGLPEGIPISYRAGDQPNNALSLNVLSPGEVAATAGTSGVIYGVTDQKKSDPYSRVNTFLHVNHSAERPRLGVLLCINGTGILNSWIRRIAGSSVTYEEMNQKASEIKAGSEGLLILPFGNGAERMLLNRDPGALFSGLNFNIHSQGHLFRAAQEGIAFSFRYGLDIMRQTGIRPGVLRAGAANMFRSTVFREAVSCVTGAVISLYNTDGSLGAARGAGIGCGYYKTEKEAFNGLRSVGVTEPDKTKTEAYKEAYSRWLRLLENSSASSAVK
ncbi:MAG: FGGY family carbohydrate kinase [Bacteroidales bacterium]|jgi:xylulokinase